MLQHLLLPPILSDAIIVNNLELYLVAISLLITSTYFMLQHLLLQPIVSAAIIVTNLDQYLVAISLLENRLKAPVARSLWYRFFEPVPPKWYQRLSLWYRVKQSVPKPSKFTQNILFGWDFNSQPLASHVAPLPSQLHSCSDRVGDIFLLK